MKIFEFQALNNLAIYYKNLLREVERLLHRILAQFDLPFGCNLLYWPTQVPNFPSDFSNQSELP